MILIYFFLCGVDQVIFHILTVIHLWKMYEKFQKKNEKSIFEKLLDLSVNLLRECELTRPKQEFTLSTVFQYQLHSHTLASLNKISLVYIRKNIRIMKLNCTFIV